MVYSICTVILFIYLSYCLQYKFVYSLFIFVLLFICFIYCLQYMHFSTLYILTLWFTIYIFLLFILFLYDLRCIHFYFYFSPLYFTKYTTLLIIFFLYALQSIQLYSLYYYSMICKDCSSTTHVFHPLWFTNYSIYSYTLYIILTIEYYA